MGKQKYFSDEEKKIANRVKAKKYASKPLGRAKRLVSAYRQSDKLANRGECTLTAEWIVDNIFSKHCKYCGVEGWDIVGCNRINNDLPHTPDNVEPCCAECNRKLEAPKIIENMSIPVYQYSLDGELVGIFTNARIAAEETGFCRKSINTCCNGGYYSHTRNKWVNVTKYNGFKWSYEN